MSGTDQARPPDDGRRNGHVVGGDPADTVAPESPEFQELVLRAQSDDPESAIAPLRDWLDRVPVDSDLAMKLRATSIMAHVFARRLDDAIRLATHAAALAAAAGAPAWEADAVAQRAMARWELGDPATAATDVITAETLIDAADGDLAWMCARNSVASIYVECGYYELAIDHYLVAAERNFAGLTGVPGNIADAMNLGWVYLRWTFDDERAGRLRTDSEVYRQRMRAARRWYSVAADRGGPDHRWAPEYQAGLAIAAACLDPAAHVAELGRRCQLDLGPDAENDRIIETVRYSYVLRRLGRHAESLEIARD